MLARVAEPRNLNLAAAEARRERRDRRLARLQWIGGGLLLIAVVSMPLSVAVETAAERHMAKRAWMAGPACPRVPQLSIAALGAKPPKPFDYKGSRFAYQIGDVNCFAAPEGWLTRATFPLCKFDAPGGIVVTTGGRTTVFEPGVGHSATVAVRRSGTTCYLGGEYRVGPKL